MIARLLVPSCAALLVLASPAAVRAGNDEGVLVGTTASTMAGAVVATVGDGSALWYNVAGLASVTRDKVDVSATAVNVRFLRMDTLLATPAERRSAGTTEVVTIPTALTYARLLRPGLVLGAGIFVTDLSDYTLRERLRRTAADDADAATWAIELRNSYSDTRAGIGLGHRVTPDLSWGVGWLVGYQRAYQTIQFAGGRDSASAFSSYSEIRTIARLSTELAAGGQARVGALRLGASVLSPRLGLRHARQATAVTTASGLGPSGDQMGFAADVAEGVDVLDFDAETAPLLVRGGVAWVGAATTVELDGDLRAFLDDPRATWNARLGARRALSPALAVGGGVFTDRSRAEESPLHYYGGAAGLESTTVISTDARTGAPRVVLTSTIGLRYAFARGDASGYRLGLDPLDVETVTLTPTDITAHEVAVNFGSGMSF